MDELVQLVAKKAKISEPVARIAINTMLGHLRKKLPGPVMDQVEKALEADVTSTVVSAAVEAISGLFKKKPAAKRKTTKMKAGKKKVKRQ